jgi:hypothetical protein
MKKLFFICLAFVFIFGLPILNLYAEDLKKYNWDQAVNHIGENAIVCGKIIDAMPIGEREFTLLGMGVGTLVPGHVGIEVSNNVKPKLPADLYKGKTVCITGIIIRNPAGGAAIKITDASQIVVK